MFGVPSRYIIWVVAEMHLMFAAFVLGVPIFAVITEVIGWRTGDSTYDKLAKEFTGLLSAAFATTAAFGGLLLFSLFILYPNLMTYLTGIFDRTMFFYAILFFGETFTLYLYHYSWDRLQNRKGAAHPHWRHAQRLRHPPAGGCGHVGNIHDVPRGHRRAGSPGQPAGGGHESSVDTP